MRARKIDAHRTRTSRALYIQPNSEPCYQCDHYNECKATGKECNIFTRWVRFGRVKDGMERKFI